MVLITMSTHKGYTLHASRGNNVHALRDDTAGGIDGSRNARGAIFGLTRGTTKGHIIRATLESLAYQTRDVLRAMENDAGARVQTLRVDGGASANQVLMQFQADVLNTETVRPEIVETTVMGAAFLAGLAVGYWDNLEEIQQIWKVDRRFTPREDRQDIEAGIQGWYRAIRALESWAADSENPEIS